jgi:hypothetical protein
MLITITFTDSITSRGWTFASEFCKASSVVNCFYLFIYYLGCCRWKLYFRRVLIGNAGNTSCIDRRHTSQHPELATYSDASLSIRCYSVNYISFLKTRYIVWVVESFPLSSAIIICNHASSMTWRTWESHVNLTTAFLDRVNIIIRK